MDVMKAAGRSSQRAASRVNALRRQRARPGHVGRPVERLLGHRGAEVVPDHRPSATLQRSSELEDRCAPRRRASLQHSRSKSAGATVRIRR